MNLLTTTEAKAIRDLLTAAGTACIDVVFESGVRVYNVPAITVKSADALHPHDVGQRFASLEDFCAAYIPSEAPALPYKEGDVCEFKRINADGSIFQCTAHIYAITNFDKYSISAVDTRTGGHHLFTHDDFMRVVRAAS